MSLLNFVIYALWLVPIVLQAAIAGVVIRRKLIKSFPVFFSYSVFVSFSEAALLFFDPSGASYARLYWYKEGVCVLLGFAAIFEILLRVLPPYSSRRFVTNLVCVLAGVLALTALLIFVSAKPPAGNCAACEIVVLAERSVRFVQASLLIVVIAFMSVLGLTWQHESIGILAGFGIYSSVALVAFEFGALHWINHMVFSVLNSAGYNVAVLIWAFYILRPWRLSTVERLRSSDLAEWNDTLSNFVNQTSRRD